MKLIKSLSIENLYRDNNQETFSRRIRSCCQIWLVIRLFDDLFPPLKTKEDYVAWLKITKNNIYAHNFPHNLVIWNKTNDSLSSSFFQKISDGLKVFWKYEKFNFLKSESVFPI